jgi:hypothetical protein
MLFSRIRSLFQQNEFIRPPLRNQSLLTKIESLSHHSDLQIFTNVFLLNGNQRLFVPLIIYDQKRGLYIFELRHWIADELKNIEISKEKAAEVENENLLFSEIKHFIRKKCDRPDIPIYNYLILEFMSKEDYQRLNDKQQALLPQERLIFMNSSSADIFQKLQSVPLFQKKQATPHHLLTQLIDIYTALDQNEKPFLLSQKQRELIQFHECDNTTITGISKSAKTTILLHKALYERLYYNKKVAIITPTTFAQEQLQKRIESYKKYFSYDQKLLNIDIFSSASYKKANYDLLLCDDAMLLREEFKKELSKEKKTQICFSENVFHSQDSLLQTSYATATVYFKNQNIILEAMHLLKRYREQNPKKQTLLIASDVTLNNLLEDMNSFFEEEIFLANAKSSYTDVTSAKIIFSNYKNIADFRSENVILLDICQEKIALIDYAINLAKKDATLLYEQECGMIKKLKEFYESSKE